MCQHCSQKGGPGSGNFNHEGRPGQVGGSSPADSSSSPSSSDKPTGGGSSKANPKIEAWSLEKFKSPEKAKAFAEWFGSSKAVDGDGNPQKLFHATSAEFTAFTPTRGGAIYLGVSSDAAMRGAEAGAREGRRQPPDRIIPVYVNADRIYGAANSDVIELVQGITGKALPEDEIAAVLDKAERIDKDTVQAFGLSYKQASNGNWVVEASSRLTPMSPVKPVDFTEFENPAIGSGKRSLQALKSTHDAALIIDEGNVSLAVFRPTQIKSATGNVGTFDPADPNITKSPSLRRKSWLRQAAIDLWTKAEGPAQVDIENAAKEFLRSQRAEIVKQLKTIDSDNPGMAADGEPAYAAEKIINQAFEPTDWDEALREAIGPAIARAIVRGYLSGKALQAGRRRRFPSVWRKDDADRFNKAKPPKKPGGGNDRPQRPATPAQAGATDWANEPLTDEEVRQVLSFELPPNVTRSVFAHTREIMEKPYWKDVNETERQRMQWSIQQGIEEGKTLRDIAKDIQGDIGSDDVRARRIAVTETTGAYAAGAMTEAAIAEEAGVQIVKTWITIGDDKVRPEHEDADGQVVEGADGLFKVGDEEAPYPGWHELSAGNRIQCRCTFLASPIVEEEKSRWIQRGKMFLDLDHAELARLE